jgi:hypothetical protein
MYHSAPSYDRWGAFQTTIGGNVMELVTVSNSIGTGDISYTGCIWQVLGRNENHIALWCVKGAVWGPGGIARKVVYIDNASYDLSDAYPLLSKSDLKEILPHCKLGVPSCRDGKEC